MTRTAIRQGKSKDEAADTVSFEGLYPAEKCKAAVHPGLAMQRRNVTRVYEMILKAK